MNILKFDKKYILFLKGTYINDCIATINERSESPELIDVDLINQGDLLDYQGDLFDLDIEYEKFDVIPNFFYDLESWPKTTSLRCWHCDCEFSSRPCFIPTNIRRMLIKINTEMLEKLVIQVYGNFCSFNCAMAYLMYVTDHKIGDNINNKAEFAKMMLCVYEIFYGEKVYHIVPSPSKTNMIHYGGNQTVTEYQTEIRLIDKNNIDYMRQRG